MRQQQYRDDNQTVIVLNKYLKEFCIVALKVQCGKKQSFNGTIVALYIEMCLNNTYLLFGQIQIIKQ